MKGRHRLFGSGRPRKKIEVFDNKLNLATTYESISEAARALDIDPTTISKYFTRNAPKPSKGRYIFSKI